MLSGTPIDGPAKEIRHDAVMSSCWRPVSPRKAGDLPAAARPQGDAARRARAFLPAAQAMERAIVGDGVRQRRDRCEPGPRSGRLWSSDRAPAAASTLARSGRGRPRLCWDFVGEESISQRDALSASTTSGRRPDHNKAPVNRPLSTT